ncbi:EAL domain-containing response regulator [Emcibacter sp. SYSU 3D8]|uniref:EAL domain-containing response regulator n=1 Tax=Emcibacter sp. SYSU 3D8 TaxID=3133969 RepID=UPI0031FED448
MSTEDGRPDGAVRTGVSHRRVLVVDDNAFVRISIRNILLDAGADYVEEARDGDEALAKVSGDLPFDLIFCDLQMPGRDGIETLRGLAGFDTQACIVLMSGEDRNILAAAGRLAKSHGLRILGNVTKPIPAEAVREFLAAANAVVHAPRKRPGGTTRISDDDIRRGLAEREFYVDFQPEVGIADGRIWGSEALVRWRHPEHGLVSPMSFIGVAEQSDTIDLLTDFVLGKALEAQTLWRTQGQDIHVAINISAHSMVNLDMPDHLARIVTMLGGSPAAVTLEVTESCLVDDLSAFLDIATRLRLKGFRLAIDDFGTGFATLEQLSRLPVSELKIDREFVAGAPDNERTRAILEASLQLARSLSLTTICEGVETQAEWNLAADLGADCIQGFYIAKPMAAGELVGWFNAWQMT